MAPDRWLCRSPPLGMASRKARRALGSWRADWNATSTEPAREKSDRPAGAVTGAAEQPAAARQASRRREKKKLRERESFRSGSGNCALDKSPLIGLPFRWNVQGMLRRRR